MKDLKCCNSSQETLLGDTVSSSAISPTSSITDPLPNQLATLAKLRAFTGTNPIVNNLSTATNLDSPPNLESQSLANLHNQTTASNRSYTGLFPNAIDNSMITSDQFLKAAKLLGIGLNTPNLTPPTALSNNLNVGNILERTSFRNDDVDLNEISEFIDRLSIVNSFNSDEKVLNAAICILFNGLPLALLNPGNVAEEIYSSKFSISMLLIN